jgi:hypothetical protein
MTSRVQALRYARNRQVPLNHPYMANYRDDYDIVFELVHNEPHDYQYASERLKKDITIINCAIKNKSRYQRTNGFQYLSKELKDNFDIVMSSIIVDPMSLYYASDKMKDNDEIATTTVSKNFDAYKYISHRLKKNKKIILKVLNISFANTIVEQIPKEMFDDDEIAMLLIKKHGNYIYKLPKNYLHKREYVLQASKTCQNLLENAPNEFRKDKEIIKNILSINSLDYTINTFAKNFKLISEELQYDEDILQIALKKNGEYLKYGSNKMKDDKNIVCNAISTYPEVIKCISDRLKNDYQFISHLIVKNIQVYPYLLEKHRDDDEIAMTVIMKKVELLRYSSIRIRSNPSFIRLATSKSVDIFKYASNELKNDKQFIERLLLIDDNRYIIPLISKNILNDEQFMLKMIEQNHKNIGYMQEGLSTNIKFAIKIIELYPSLYTNFSSSVQCNTQFILAIYRTMSEKEKKQYIKRVQASNIENICVKYLFKTHELYAVDYIA